jgi:hypothetical protein
MVFCICRGISCIKYIGEVGFRPSFGRLVVEGIFPLSQSIVEELETTLYAGWEAFDVI